MEQGEQKPESPVAEEVSEARAPQGSLELEPGARLRLGYREGAVGVVRGGRGKPYEVRITWDGQKCPVYVAFTSLEREFREGRLVVLADAVCPATPGRGRPGRG